MASPQQEQVSYMHVHSLSYSDRVRALAMRNIEDMKAVILITGDSNGGISIYQSPLSCTRPPKFTLQHHFIGHCVSNCDDYVIDIDIDHHQRLFISLSCNGDELRLWNFTDITVPHLIRSVAFDFAGCVKYSESGLIAAGAIDGILRVYEKGFLSLRWSCVVHDTSTIGDMSIAWSPSNRLAACFSSHTSRLHVVQVWDSSFKPLYRFKQQSYPYGEDCVMFASNHVLLSCGAVKVHWYYIVKPDVMNVLMEKTALPFCRDVMKIIVAYLPVAAHHTHPDAIGSIAALNSQLVVSSGWDDVCRVYNANKPHVIRSWSHDYSERMSSCLYPCAGDRTGFVLASHANNGRVRIGIIVSQLPRQKCRSSATVSTVGKGKKRKLERTTHTKRSAKKKSKRMKR